MFARSELDGVRRNTLFFAEQKKKTLQNSVKVVKDNFRDDAKQQNPFLV